MKVRGVRDRYTDIQEMNASYEQRTSNGASSPSEIFAHSAFEAPIVETIGTSTVQSKLNFPGVSDKKRSHTGYFEYRLDEDGKIWCKWDPMIPKDPFTFSCSSRVELPVKFFDGSAREMRQLLAEIVGPYTFSYDEKSETATATPRTDLEGKGFILRNGMLVEVALSEASSWHLHDGQGGPKLKNGVKIKEIQVSSEAIFARGSDNVLYIYSPGSYRRTQELRWQAKYGFKDLGTIRFPQGARDWAVGFSTQAKPMQRRGLQFMNPWTDIDSYYGTENKISNGATLTFGVIPRNGRTIQIWDTGLPPDLHRGFITPDRGRVQAVKIAQAGSVWFLYGYDRNGRPCLYWRPYNYEKFGACVGMEHSLNPESDSQESSRVHDLGEGVGSIPLQGWEEINFPFLENAACITDCMSIHCTGEGDTARELRIEGTNSLGQAGFYYKGLIEPEWRFKTGVGNTIHGKKISVGIADPAKATPYELTRDYTLGSTWSGMQDAPMVQVALLQFHPYQTQAEESILRFTLGSSKIVDVKFRTADAWSPFSRSRVEDAAVWKGVGVAKILVGSLEIPHTLLTCEDPEIHGFVSKYLMPYDGIPNFFEVIADLDKIEIRTDGKLRLPSFAFTCTRNDTGETLFEKQALSAALVSRAHMSIHSARRVIRKNNRLLAKIENFTNDFRHKARKMLRRWRKVNVLLGVARFFTGMANMRSLPFVGAVLELVPRLISAHKIAFKNARDSKFSPQGLVRAREQIQKNINAAELAIIQRASF